jgi:hypothetical protein
MCLIFLCNKSPLVKLVFDKVMFCYLIFVSSVSALISYVINPGFIRLGHDQNMF